MTEKSRVMKRQEVFCPTSSLKGFPRALSVWEAAALCGARKRAYVLSQYWLES